MPAFSGLATVVPTPPTRAEYAARAQRLTADLAWLRAQVEHRAGAANASLLHDAAAGALHRLLGAAGAYDGAGGGDAR